MPYEDEKVGHQGSVQLVLDVDEPAVKAKVSCDSGQLARSLLGCGPGLQECLTLFAPLVPFCDESAKDLHQAGAQGARLQRTSHQATLDTCHPQHRAPASATAGCNSSSVDAQ